MQIQVTVTYKDESRESEEKTVRISFSREDSDPDTIKASVLLNPDYMTNSSVRGVSLTGSYNELYELCCEALGIDYGITSDHAFSFASKSVSFRVNYPEEPVLEINLST